MDHNFDLNDRFGRSTEAKAHITRRFGLFPFYYITLFCFCLKLFLIDSGRERAGFQRVRRFLKIEIISVLMTDDDDDDDDDDEDDDDDDDDDDDHDDDRDDDRDDEDGNADGTAAAAAADILLYSAAAAADDDDDEHDYDCSVVAAIAAGVVVGVLVGCCCFLLLVRSNSLSFAYESKPEETDKEGRFVVDARDHVRKARAANLFKSFQLIFSWFDKNLIFAWSNG